MTVFRRNRLVMALGAAGVLAALTAMPIYADNIKCSDFEIVPLDVGVIPAGENDFNVIVDIDCIIYLGANVNGNVTEPDDTAWSVLVGPTGNVSGNIKEKGEGFVFMVVGHDQVYKGNIKEEGPGDVGVQVDGVFDGNVEEQGDGHVAIQIFGPAPAGGPGYFDGNASEKDAGQAILSIEPGAIGFNGGFKEEGDGFCRIAIDGPVLHDGNIKCD